MDSSNTIKEFFENRGGIKMELNTISGLAIAGLSAPLSSRLEYRLLCSLQEG